jgi:hypothetical protein
MVSSVASLLETTALVFLCSAWAWFFFFSVTTQCLSGQRFRTHNPFRPFTFSFSEMHRLMSRIISMHLQAATKKSYVKDILKKLFHARIGAEPMRVRVIIKNQTTNVFNLKIKK